MTDEFADLMEDSARGYHHKMATYQLQLQEELQRNIDALKQWGLVEIANGETNRQKIAWYVQQRIERVRQNLHYEMEQMRLKLLLDKEELDLAIHDRCFGTKSEISDVAKQKGKSNSAQQS